LCKSFEQNWFLSQKAKRKHIILRRNEPFAQVVVPDHKELDRGTLKAIIWQAGLTEAEFIELL